MRRAYAFVRKAGSGGGGEGEAEQKNAPLPPCISPFPSFLPELLREKEAGGGEQFRLEIRKKGKVKKTGRRGTIIAFSANLFLFLFCS